MIESVNAVVMWPDTLSPYLPLKHHDEKIGLCPNKNCYQLDMHSGISFKIKRPNRSPLVPLEELSPLKVTHIHVRIAQKSCARPANANAFPSSSSSLLPVFPVFLVLVLLFFFTHTHTHHTANANHSRTPHTVTNFPTTQPLI